MLQQKTNIQENNPIWPQTPDYHYRILIVGGSGSSFKKCKSFESIYKNG